MYKRYPSVQAMSAFLQAVRTGSFTQAARELDLTHSAISQQIRTLEEFIGQPLFIRESGGIQLTDAGQLFAQLLPDGLAQIERALASVKHRQAPLKLTLDVDAELAARWLNARLPALLQALSGYEVTLLSRSGGADRIALERADLSLRYGYGDWEDCEMVHICSDSVTPVAAPSLMTRFGLESPLTLAQLMRLPLLGYTRRSWVPWLEAAGLQPVEPHTRVVFDSAANLLDAVEAGVGIGLGRGLICRDALNAGRLLAPTSIVIPAQYNLYAVWQHGQGERVAPVVEAIRRMAAETLSPSLDSG